MLELPFIHLQMPFWSLLGAGFLGGVLAGLIGVGGGVITNPLLIFLGLPARFAAGTMPLASAANAFSALSLMKLRESIDLRLGAVLGLGGMGGGLLGVLLVRSLNRGPRLDLLIQLLYVLLLSLTIWRFLVLKEEENAAPKPWKLLLSMPWRKRFPTTGGEPVSLWPLLLLAGGVGLLAAVMGIGGAALLSPALTLVLGLDLKRVIPLSLVFVFFTSLGNAADHLLLSGNSDLVLGLVLMVGGSLGSGLGVRLRHFLSGRNLSLLFAGVMGVILVRVFWSAFSGGGTIPGELLGAAHHYSRWWALAAFGAPPLVGWLAGKVNRVIWGRS